MIIADTSIWISFFRGSSQAITKHLSDLLDEQKLMLCSPIRVEILSGASPKNYRTLSSVLSALPLVEPGPDEWGLVDDWVEIAGRKGFRFSVADLLIAAVTQRHAKELWTLDGDFSHMSSLGFIQLHLFHNH